MDAPLQIGALVRYYLNGWRVGHLEEIKGAQAHIRPVAGASNPRCRWIPLTSVEPITKDK